MDDPSRYGIALMGFKCYCLIFQVNQKLSLQNEKEFIFFIVFVPVKFTLHNAEANRAVIHLTKSLVVPSLIAGGNQAWHINQL